MPLIAAGAIAAGGAIGGALIGSHAAGKAADKQAEAAKSAAQLQAEAADKALDFQKEQWNTTQANQKPWLETGKAALARLATMMSPGGEFMKTFTPADMATYDPGFDFRLQQGQKALERSAAARGTSFSGGTLKSLARYAQDYGSNEYQNAFARFTTDQTNRYNRLASLAGVGQTAANNVANLGAEFANQAGQNVMGTAQNIGSLMMGGANAQAAGTMGAANAWSSGLGGVANAAQNYALYKMMQPQAAPVAPTPQFNLDPSSLPVSRTSPLVAMPPLQAGLDPASLPVNRTILPLS